VFSAIEAVRHGGAGERERWRGYLRSSSKKRCGATRWISAGPPRSARWSNEPRVDCPRGNIEVRKIWPACQEESTYRRTLARLSLFAYSMLFSRRAHVDVDK